MSELAVRTVSGIGMIAVALLAAALGGYYFMLLAATAATVMYYEWSRLVRGWGLGWQVGGFFYALLPAIALLWIRERDAQGLLLILWVFIVTWSTDIGAYFVGRAIGKKKLAPSISPGKTVAGFWGGVGIAALVAGLWTATNDLPRLLFVLAVPFAMAAQGGDLFESWIKRRSGVKDSGAILPGHGGVLDRLDGLVPVAVLTAVAQMAGLA
jgi:phosphatidate cytidylyltransferase